MGLLGQTGNSLARGGVGAVRLATDPRAQINAVKAAGNAIAHPLDTAGTLYQGVRAFAAKPLGEQADSAFKFAAGTLATAGLGKMSALAGEATYAGTMRAVDSLGAASESFVSRGWGPSARFVDEPSSLGNTGSAGSAAASEKSYGVAFFGDSNLGYYTRDGATIGRDGKSFFFMPLQDSAIVKDAADAALYTGRAPSVEAAYLNSGDVYGLSFPTNEMSVARPTAVDAAGWPHFLEGGSTAVRLGDGANAGYLVNPTQEFVIPGGNQVPSGSVLFQLGLNGEWMPLKRF